MDKIIGLLTTILVGIPLMIVAFVISWRMDNDSVAKTELNDDRDVRYYVPCRCRGGRRNNGHDKEGKR